MSVYFIQAGEREAILRRFEAKYIPEPNSGCWLWIGALSTHGYGQLGINGKIVDAHRVSWMLYRGPIPAGADICHRCDVRPCVNFEHHFVGSRSDNVRDCVAKGRWRGPMLIGTANPAAKLDEAAVLAIWRSSGTAAALAERFGVGRATIDDIRRGRKWRHLTEAPAPDAAA